MKNFWILVFSLLLASTAPARAQRYVKTFNTASEAWNANLNDVNTNIFIMGRTSPNDGGGGLFWYDKSATTTTNAGMVWGNKYSGRLFRIWDKKIDPRWWGADDSCAVDSSSIFNSIITFVKDPTYGWQKDSGQLDSGENVSTFSVDMQGCWQWDATVNLSGVTLEGKPGSLAGDYGAHSIVHIKHGGIGILWDFNGDGTRFRNGGIHNLFLTGYSEQYQQNKKDIQSVTSRLVFDVLNADAPATLDDNQIWTASNTCFFFAADGAYLGSGRVYTTAASATPGQTTITLQTGSDVYTSVNGSSGGLLTTSAKVVFAPRVTDEISTTPFNDPSLAGSCAISLKNTRGGVGGVLDIDNVYMTRFHTGLRIGPGLLGGASSISDITTQNCRFAGIAFPRPPNTADMFFTGQIYTSGYYATDYTLPVGVNQTVTVSSASPAVITTSVPHTYPAGAAVRFGATTVPTGMSTNSLYYVVTNGLTANTFQISTTVAGTPVATSSTGSGVYIKGQVFDTPALHYSTYGIYGLGDLTKWGKILAEESAYANVYAFRAIGPSIDFLFSDGILRYGVAVAPGYLNYNPPTTTFYDNWISIGTLLLKNQLSGLPLDTVHNTTVGVYFESSPGTSYFAGVAIEQLHVIRSSSGDVPITYAFDLQPTVYNNRAKLSSLVERNGFITFSNPSSKNPEVAPFQLSSLSEMVNGIYTPFGQNQIDFGISSQRVMSLTSGKTKISNSTGTDILSLSNDSNSREVTVSIGTDSLSFDNKTNSTRFGTFISGSTGALIIGSGAATTPRSTDLKFETAAAGTTNTPAGTAGLYLSGGTGDSPTGGGLDIYTADVGASGTSAQLFTRKWNIPRTGGLRAIGSAADISGIAAGQINYVAGSVNAWRMYDGSYWQPLSVQGAEATVASATTINLGFATSDKVSITGTTTITSFGLATAGTRRQGRFTGILTLTHNATSLILPTGASISTAAGDSFEAQSLGGSNWVVIWYQRPSGAALVGASGANPSASVGLTAVNGSASTFLRSDGAPALDISISPTWTGAHVLSKSGALSLPTFSLTGAPITGGTATTTKPLALIETTGATSTGWSTSGTMLGVNSPSGFGGRVVDFQANGTSLLSLSSAGTLSGIGNFTASGSMTAGAALNLAWFGRSLMKSPSDGVIGLYDSTSASFTRLQLGGTTTSFSALGVSGTTVAVQLADGTAGGKLSVGTTQSKVGGTISQKFASTGTPASAVETDLYTYTAVASALGTDGDGLTFTSGGVFAGNASATSQLRVYFGGTQIFASGALTAAAAGSWRIDTFVIRDSSSSVRCVSTLTTANAITVPLTTQTDVTGLTLSNTQIIKVTGQGGGASPALNDAVCKLGRVRFEPVF